MTKRVINFNLKWLKYNKKLVRVGILIIVLEMIYHIFTMKYLFSEGKPVLSFNYILESFVIIVGFAVLFIGVVDDKKLTLKLFNDENSAFQIFSTFLALIFTISFILLFLIAPNLFSHLSLEDNIIEWLSTFFLFGCSSAFIVSSIFYRKSLGSSKFNLWGFYFLSFVFFVLAMEEISWFQRVLEFETPKNSVFKYNNQRELNLHNFATNYVENAYYFGSFLVLVVLPFLGFLFNDVFKRFQLSMFIPRPFIVLIGSLFCAFNYDMWNIVFIQYSFFGTLIILFYYRLFCEPRWNKLLLLATMSLMVITQFLFIYFGDNFDRLWEVTEYKEFLISFGFLIYALDLTIHVIGKKDFSIP